MITIKNSSGLVFGFNENGSIQQIIVEPIRISLKSASEFSKSGANLYLRKRAGNLQFIPLLGPESHSSFQFSSDAFYVHGMWEGIEYTCKLRLSVNNPSWSWQIEVKNTTGKPLELDLVYVQDIGLKPASSGLVNEYYVSQYLERLVFNDPKYGSVLCCRQNMKESVGNPWLMVACNNKAMAASTDGMQFYGKTYRETGIPEGLLSNTMGGNSAGESPVISLQEHPFVVEPDSQHTSIFAVKYLDHHSGASSIDDLSKLESLFQEFEYEAINWEPKMAKQPQQNLFCNTSFLPVDDLTDTEIEQYFGKEKRHAETENGKLLSFFCQQNNHVVLRAKEILADRPHGHIMQAQAGFVPSEAIVSTTAFAFGVFHSHLSQGNTNFNVMLSVCTSQFNQSAETGQRIFVDVDGTSYLLGVPSAFEMGLNHCRWIYKSGSRTFQVRSWTSKTAPAVHLDFKVLTGKKVKLLLTHDFDELNHWNVLQRPKPNEFEVLPKKGSMIHEKFPDARFRVLVNSVHINYSAHINEIASFGNIQSCKSPFFTIKVDETTAFSLSFLGEVPAKTDFTRIDNIDDYWQSENQEAQKIWNHLSLNLRLKSSHSDISAIHEILPWYGMNALTHLLTPYGLEQFSGAAWGTRDVSQGPVDLLLTLEKYSEVKQILKTIFSNQNTDGGWPQWWMFDSYSKIRAHDSHGDVFYWVIIALSDYIKVTGDYSILDVVVPYFNLNEGAESEYKPVSEHVERLVQMIVDSFIPGTSLVPFGGGDWNDSLQPVSKELAERMISSWTVEMNYQAFRQLSFVYQKTDAAKANKLHEICEQIKTDFNKFLVKDGIVAGYGLVEEDKSISVLLHPTDTKTGIKYSILPMNRGIISEIFTKEQAEKHQVLINKHLKGPDGARLMDKPLKYRGGIQTIFQRAESSTFFGREIGLMYIHEHIRYAESQARIGNAEVFVNALRQAIPVGYHEIVPNGDTRQANCYYSSSDVTFKTRYEADERYHEINSGSLTLKGGWRVYSSGPGIYVSMIVSRLLGLQVEYGQILIDPVLPRSMDGLTASMDFLGKKIKLQYKIKEKCFSPDTISINGKNLTFKIQENKYRQGGALIPKEEFISFLDQPVNLVEIQL